LKLLVVFIYLFIYILISMYLCIYVSLYSFTTYKNAESRPPSTAERKVPRRRCIQSFLYYQLCGRMKVITHYSAVSYLRNRYIYVYIFIFLDTMILIWYLESYSLFFGILIFVIIHIHVYSVISWLTWSTYSPTTANTHCAGNCFRKSSSSSSSIWDSCRWS